MMEVHRSVAAAVRFRLLNRDDLPLLCRWLAAPHVRTWFARVPLDLDAVERKYAPRIDQTVPTRVFVFYTGDEPLGMIQCYRHVDHPSWDRTVGVPAAAGIDYLIGDPDQCGRGLGSATIAAFTPIVFDLYPDITTIVSTPQRDNRASCRALEKAGFTLLHERDLDSDDPSDNGISAVYALPRAT